MTQAFSPTEIFKRASASTLRAIAERDDLTVGFGPEPAGVAGTRVKLPNPARELPAEAVRLLTREALTREPPPPSARRVVDLWRPWLEGKIGKDIGELERSVSDQDSYARATRRLIQDLDLELGELDDSSSDENQGEG